MSRTSGSGDDVMSSRRWALWPAVCIGKRRQRTNNSRHNCIDSNQILLNDKDQPVHIMGYAQGMKSAIYDCHATTIDMYKTDSKAEISSQKTEIKVL